MNTSIIFFLFTGILFTSMMLLLGHYYNIGIHSKDFKSKQSPDYNTLLIVIVCYAIAFFSWVVFLILIFLKFLTTLNEIISNN